MGYKVTATIHGKRITADKTWRKRKGAEEYARITNKLSFGRRARVIKTKKKK